MKKCRRKGKIFYAVFEAAKSLSEKAREKTGLQDDGFALLTAT